MQDLEKLLMSPPSRPKRKKGPKLRNIEAGLWSLIKTNIPKSRTIELDRIEAFGTLGFPDVLCCNEDGLFSFLELKVQHGKKINLSPHQVSWLTRHGHANCFIVVRSADMGLNVFLGRDSVDLCLDGPSAVSPLKTFTYPLSEYDWEGFWALTAPRSGV